MITRWERRQCRVVSYEVIQATAEMSTSSLNAVFPLLFDDNDYNSEMHAWLLKRSKKRSERGDANFLI